MIHTRPNILKQILEATREIWDRPETRPEVRENFTKILDCGTPALGWEVYASDTEEKRCYHTCKSRFCPSCGYRATLLWLREQEAFLPEISYAGMVFTMPRSLWLIFQQNRHLLHDLPALEAGVIQDWVRLRYGVRVIILVVAHTFGGDLKFNCHLHILVSGGGLQESEGRWIPRLDFNKDALMRMWRYAVITHLRGALEAQVLKSDLTLQQVKEILKDAYERHPYWITYLDKVVSKSHFVRYAARYIRRPPIASRRLLRLTDRMVEFLAKDTKRRQSVPTSFSPRAFLARLAQHVPTRYGHAIRYFGLSAPRTKGVAWSAMFAILGQQQQPRPLRLSWRNSLRKYFGVDPLIDSRGQMMHWVGRGKLVTRSVQ